MLKSRAVAITGGLSSPTKVGAGYSIPAARCVTGRRLSRLPGTVCSRCYAKDRNRYRMSPVRKAMDRRFRSLRHPEWVEAMVSLVSPLAYFRWHDSGDLQGSWHLSRIMEVCRRTPRTKHWLPTREWDGGEGRPKLLETWLAAGNVPPPNVCIRKSTYSLNQEPPGGDGQYSVVVNRRDKVTCRATVTPNATCRSLRCRKCWNKNVRVVRYMRH